MEFEFQGGFEDKLDVKDIFGFLESAGARVPSRGKPQFTWTLSPQPRTTILDGSRNSDWNGEPRPKHAAYFLVIA